MLKVFKNYFLVFKKWTSRMYPVHVANVSKICFKPSNFKIS
jgi:hypothetical protein